MVTEAGGKVTAVDGGEFNLDEGSVLASNLDLHPLVLERLKAA
jgi:myo-inositol-1(or 4)-monophosphatase